MELFFSSEKIHSQLIQRTSQILKLLLSERQIDDNTLNMIWGNCVRDGEGTSIKLIEVIQEIVVNIKAPEVGFFINKLCSKAPQNLRGQELDLILNLSKTNSEKVNEELMSVIRIEVLDFFWKYLFNE